MGKNRPSSQLGMYTQRIAAVLLVCTACTPPTRADVYNVQHRDLTSVPTDIPSTATGVDLRYNYIRTIPARVFSHLTACTFIKLSSNNISVVDPQAFCGSAVRALYLGRNTLTSVPNVSCVASQLTTFTINHNKISADTLDDRVLKDFSSLRYLSFVSVPLSRANLSDMFAPIFDTVTTFLVAATGITGVKLGRQLQNMTQVKTASISLNSVETFHDDAFSNWQSVLIFECYRCKLVKIPIFPDGTALKTLKLASNSLTHIPEKRLNMLTHLTKLSLSKNPLGENISVIFNWKNRTSLQVLEIASTGVNDDILSRFAFSEFPSLTALDISNNNLAIMPNLTGLSDLENLHVSGNAITTIAPDSLRNLVKLAKLDLSGNLIASWSNITGLYSIASTLQELVLGGNPVDGLAEGIWNFTALTKLSLAGTNVGCLNEPPDTIHLTHLDLSDATYLDCSCLCWLKNQSFVALSEAPCSDPSSAASIPWGHLEDAQLGCPRETSTLDTSTTAHVSTESFDSVRSTVMTGKHWTHYSTDTLSSTGALDDKSTEASTVHTSTSDTPTTYLFGISTVEEEQQVTTEFSLNTISPSISSTNSTPDGESVQFTTRGMASQSESSTNSTPDGESVQFTTRGMASQSESSTNSTPDGESVQFTTRGMASQSESTRTFPNQHPEGFVLSWNTWLPWSECTRSCGEGSHFRILLCQSEYDDVTMCTRHLYTETNIVLGYTIEVRACNTHICPVDGVWSAWSDWSECRVTCGEGIRLRSRDCAGPFYGGKPCDPISPNLVETCQGPPCSEVKNNIRAGLDVVYTDSDKQPLNQGLGVMYIGLVLLLGVALLISDLPTILSHIRFGFGYSRRERDVSR